MSFAKLVAWGALTAAYLFVMSVEVFAQGSIPASSMPGLW